MQGFRSYKRKIFISVHLELGILKILYKILTKYEQSRFLPNVMRFMFLPVISLFPSQLKLRSDIATFQQSAKKTRKQLVTFEECSTYLIQWRILHFDPQLRMETEGLPVPVSTFSSRPRPTSPPSL